ncbi:Retrotransposon-derived protein PEG10 [Zancudomyces culisetae]|uniref:Retrotransposon-derived protein PEG10 n=1 Tax=Zancudomyces culisetae TaxID=1213189 RepID=A0A1R1PTZ0_ZANCU|nr:Retrotransposon-derived protein PEG10 [Zancudomyces culisetae]|eukprot:OMH84428.1 Retrotransposon-derived protein PEG10 [Zancudomyces culisetae]
MSEKKSAEKKAAETNPFRMAELKSPELEKFDGSAANYDIFMSRLRFHYWSYPEHFELDKQKIKFIGSHLTGAASLWFLNLVDSKPTLLEDYDIFLAAFKSRFSDPTAQATAINKMTNLKQGKRPLAEHAADFITYANLSGFNDVAKIHTFVNSLNKDILLYLFATELPNTLDEVINVAARVENRTNPKQPTTNGTNGCGCHYPPPPLPPQTPRTPGTPHPRRTPAQKRPKPVSLLLKTGPFCSRLPSQKGFKRPHPTVAGKLLLGNSYSRYTNSSDVPKKFLKLIKLTNENIDYPVLALIDSGASANFICEKYLKELNLPTERLDRPVAVETIDGKPLSETDIGYKAHRIKLTIGQHQEYTDLYPIRSQHAKIILGLSWLRKHNPSIDWPSLSIKIDSNFCKYRSLPKTETLNMVYRCPDPSDDESETRKSKLAANPYIRTRELKPRYTKVGLPNVDKTPFFGKKWAEKIRSSYFSDLMELQECVNQATNKATNKQEQNTDPMPIPPVNQEPGSESDYFSADEPEIAKQTEANQADHAEFEEPKQPAETKEEKPPQITEISPPTLEPKNAPPDTATPSTIRNTHSRRSPALKNK